MDHLTEPLVRLFEICFSLKAGESGQFFWEQGKNIETKDKQGVAREFGFRFPQRLLLPVDFFPIPDIQILEKNFDSFCESHSSNSVRITYVKFSTLEVRLLNFIQTCLAGFYRNTSMTLNAADFQRIHEVNVL